MANGRRISAATCSRPASVTSTQPLRACDGIVDKRFSERGKAWWDCFQAVGLKKNAPDRQLAKSRKARRQGQHCFVGDGASAKREVERLELAIPDSATGPT